jgi:hypothetical protein
VAFARLEGVAKEAHSFGGGIAKSLMHELRLRDVRCGGSDHHLRDFVDQIVRVIELDDVDIHNHSELIDGGC